MKLRFGPVSTRSIRVFVLEWGSGGKGLRLLPVSKGFIDLTSLMCGVLWSSLPAQ